MSSLDYFFSLQGEGLRQQIRKVISKNKNLQNYNEIELRKILISFYSNENMLDPEEIEYIESNEYNNAMDKNPTSKEELFRLIDELKNENKKKIDIKSKIHITTNKNEENENKIHITAKENEWLNTNFGKFLNKYSKDYISIFSNKKYVFFQFEEKIEIWDISNINANEWSLFKIMEINNGFNNFFTSSEKYLIESNDKEINFWDIEKDWKKIKTLKHDYGYTVNEIDQLENLVLNDNYLCYNLKEIIIILNISNYKIVREIEDYEQIQSLELYKNYFIIGTYNEIVIFDISSTNPSQWHEITILKHENNTFCMFFDEKYLFSGGNNAILNIWDISDKNPKNWNLVNTFFEKTSDFWISNICIIKENNQKYLFSSAENKIKVYNITSSNPEKWYEFKFKNYSFLYFIKLIPILQNSNIGIDFNLNLKEQMLTLFKQCSTYKELNKLMIRVVELEIPSPLYDFDPIEDENPDNDWWVESDSRYQLLKEINKLGLITLGAQEDSEVPETRRQNFIKDGILSINTSADLIFFGPTEIMNKLYEKLNDEDFLTIIQNTNVENMKKKEFILNITTFKDSKQDVGSSRIYQDKDGKYYSDYNPYLDLKDYLNVDFYDELVKLPCFIVQDLVLNRSPDHKGGIFTKIKYYLEKIINGCVLYILEFNKSLTEKYNKISSSKKKLIFINENFKREISLMKRGDLIEFPIKSDNGRYIIDEIDGELKAVELYTELDDYGGVPPNFFTITQFSIGYFNEDNIVTDPKSKFERKSSWHMNEQVSFIDCEELKLNKLKQANVFSYANYFYTFVKYKNINYCIIESVADKKTFISRFKNKKTQFLETHIFDIENFPEFENIMNENNVLYSNILYISWSMFEID